MSHLETYGAADLQCSLQIYGRVNLSSDHFAHETAIIEDGAAIGAGTVIWHHSHVRAASEIGRDCTLGKNVYIDVGVVVGNRVKIQNNVSLYSGVAVHDDVFIGPSVVFTNDRFPRADSTHFVKLPTVISRGASVGANATILCGCTVGEYAMVGAGSVVTRDVASYALVAGNPARQVGVVCLCGRPRSTEQTDSTVICLTCGRRFKEARD